MPNRYYGNVIWTNHALDRLGERGLSQEMALQTFKYPEKTIAGKTHGSFEYQRKFDISTVTIIAKQNEKYEWIILSCWIDPPLPGTADEKEQKRYRKYQKATFWGKFWLTIKQLIFGF